MTANVRTAANIAELVGKFPGLGIDTFIPERDYNQAMNELIELRSYISASHTTQGRYSKSDVEAVSRTLLLSTLIDENACNEQVTLFRETFGESVEITPELCLSVADKFDWGWAARHLLSPAARAEYERVMAHAWARAYMADSKRKKP